MTTQTPITDRMRANINSGPYLENVLAIAEELTAACDKYKLKHPPVEYVREVLLYAEVNGVLTADGIRHLLGDICEACAKYSIPIPSVFGLFIGMSLIGEDAESCWRGLLATLRFAAGETLTELEKDRAFSFGFSAGTRPEVLRPIIENTAALEALWFRDGDTGAAVAFLVQLGQWRLN